MKKAVEGDHKNHMPQEKQNVEEMDAQTKKQQAATAAVEKNQDLGSSKDGPNHGNRPGGRQASSGATTADGTTAALVAGATVAGAIAVARQGGGGHHNNTGCDCWDDCCACFDDCDGCVCTIS